LSRDDGSDSLRFTLFRLDDNVVCRWNRERGEMYWRPGARISIDFLQKRVFDKENLLKRYDVSIR
jgi:hypothetical protein